MISFLFGLFLTKAAAEIPKLMVPDPIFNSIKTSYSFEKGEIQPELSDITLELSGTGDKIKVPVGYTQEVIDLAEYVDRKNKTVAWALQTQFQPSDKTTIYFISRYKPTFGTSGGKVGYPCGSAFKIASRSNKLLNTSKILSALNGEYINMIGGDYLIMHQDDKKLKIAYFKVRDSRWTHQLCNM
ncbi:MAG: hypothetical protein H6623_04965 [Bdellovibrionaceae bacterium]|nr:hypothetical protein [Pseudobdellovibrionaceae bacterium]